MVCVRTLAEKVQRTTYAYLTKLCRCTHAFKRTETGHTGFELCLKKGIITLRWKFILYHDNPMRTRFKIPFIVLAFYCVLLSSIGNVLKRATLLRGVARGRGWIKFGGSVTCYTVDTDVATALGTSIASSWNAPLAIRVCDAFVTPVSVLAVRHFVRIFDCVLYQNWRFVYCIVPKAAFTLGEYQLLRDVRLIPFPMYEISQKISGHLDYNDLCKQCEVTFIKLYE